MTLYGGLIVHSTDTFFSEHYC